MPAVRRVFHLGTAVNLVVVAVGCVLAGLATSTAVSGGGTIAVVAVVALVSMSALVLLPQDVAAGAMVAVGFGASAFLGDSRLAPTAADASGSFSLSPLKIVPLAVMVAGLVLWRPLLGTRRAADPDAVRAPWPRALVWLAGYVAWIGLSSAIALDSRFALLRWVQGVIPALVAIAFGLRWVRNRTLLHLVLIAAATHVLLATFLAPDRVPGEPTQRIGGYLHPLLLAVEAAYVIVVAAWFLRRREHTAGALLALGLAANALVNARGRTGFIAAVAGVAAVVVIGTRSAEAVTRRAGRILLGVAVACVYLYTQAATLDAWLWRNQGEVGRNTVSGRTPLWSTVIDLAADRPVTGWGAGALRAGPIAVEAVIRTAKPQDTWGHAHNGLLEALITGGVVGALLWLCFVGAVLRSLLRLDGSIRIVTVGLWVAVMGVGLTIGDPAWFGLSWYLLLALAVVGAAREQPSTVVADAVGADVRSSVVGTRRSR